jgi:hypothetical protein
MYELMFTLVDIEATARLTGDVRTSEAARSRTRNYRVVAADGIHERGDGAKEGMHLRKTNGTILQKTH